MISPVSRRYLQRVNCPQKNMQVNQLTALTQPDAAHTYPHAHIERDDRDSDVLCCFSVHIGELQPGVVLLLPRTQRIPCYKRWNCGEGKIGVHKHVAATSPSNCLQSYKRLLKGGFTVIKYKPDHDFHTVSRIMASG